MRELHAHARQFPGYDTIYMYYIFCRTRMYTICVCVIEAVTLSFRQERGLEEGLSEREKLKADLAQSQLNIQQQEIKIQQVC